MTDISHRIETHRASIKTAVAHGQADRAATLVNIVIGFRILIGEIAVKLQPANKLAAKLEGRF